MSPSRLLRALIGPRCGLAHSLGHPAYALLARLRTANRTQGALIFWVAVALIGAVKEAVAKAQEMAYLWGTVTFASQPGKISRFSGFPLHCSGGSLQLWAVSACNVGANRKRALASAAP